MWEDIDLVPRRDRAGAPAGGRELAELGLLLVAALVAGILSLFA